MIKCCKFGRNSSLIIIIFNTGRTNKRKKNIKDNGYFIIIIYFSKLIDTSVKIN